MSKTLSLTAKRILAGCYLLVLMLLVGNYYLDWSLFPGFDKKALAVATFVGVVLLHRYGGGMISDIEAYRASKRRSTGAGD